MHARVCVRGMCICVRAYYLSVHLVCAYVCIHVYVLGVCARMSMCLPT